MKRMHTRGLGRGREVPIEQMEEEERSCSLSHPRMPQARRQANARAQERGEVALFVTSEGEGVELPISHLIVR